MNNLEKISLLRITKDAEFAVSFIKSMSYMDEQAAQLYMFNFYGLFAMIAYEGSNYCLKHSIHTQILSDTLERARHRVKLYEDTSMGISGVSSYVLETLLPVHEAYMQKDLVLSKVTKRLQKDTGVTFVDNLPVFTTLGASYDTGMGEDAEKLFDGEFIRNNAAELGRQLVILNGSNAGRSIRKCLVVNPKDISIKDVFARDLYSNKFNGKNTPALNSSLFMMQCRQNFINTCLSSSIEDETILKYKYITAYTNLKSLKSLKTEHVVQSLNRFSTTVIDEVLASPFAEQVLSVNGRRFRNILVHNDIRQGFTENDVQADRRLYGLVEAYFEGDNYEEFSKKVDLLSGTIADKLNIWSHGN